MDTFPRGLDQTWRQTNTSVRCLPLSLLNPAEGLKGRTQGGTSDVGVVKFRCIIEPGSFNVIAKRCTVLSSAYSFANRECLAFVVCQLSTSRLKCLLSEVDACK
ncbi:hypothetical protein NPIL_540151 [Nephila pilipes]|uniref:Uncharacterized protein n=1 Tax=Nephila pilipes TaxID=299642 RepID=A0A8X6TA12_NEPPI|nr:hypothetical protein NPIL_540151 [Nephila pilipes]